MEWFIQKKNVFWWTPLLLKFKFQIEHLDNIFWAVLPTPYSLDIIDWYPPNTIFMSSSSLHLSHVGTNTVFHWISKTANHRWWGGKCWRIYWFIFFYKSTESKIQHCICYYLFSFSQHFSITCSLIRTTQGYFLTTDAWDWILHPCIPAIVWFYSFNWRTGSCTHSCTQHKSFKMRLSAIFQKCKSHTACHLWGLTRWDSAHKHMWSFILCLLWWS